MSENCKQGEEWQLHRETLHCCFEAGRVSFQINAEALTPSDSFPYRRCTISFNNRNCPEVYHNLKKAQRRCGGGDCKGVGEYRSNGTGPWDGVFGGGSVGATVQ